nr:ABC transporter substrate binding protein [uncultured Methanospirillum sp.]
MEQNIQVFKRVILMLVLVSLFSIPASSELILQSDDPAHSDFSESSVKTILLLVSTDGKSPYETLFITGISEELKKNSSVPLRFVTEYLNIPDYRDETYLSKIDDLYRYKIQALKPDVIITKDILAIDLLSGMPLELVQGIPIISDVDPGVIHNLTITPVVPEKGYSTGKNIETILSLFPHTRQIYVISGSGPDEIDELEALKQQISDMNLSVPVTYLINQSHNELLPQISKIPRDSAILYISYAQDINGNHFSPEDSLSRIYTIAQAPIFGPSETYVNRGIVGGYLLSPEMYGKEIGSLALQALQGNITNQGELDPEDLRIYKFDWNELSRFNIDPAILPKGSIIVNREDSVWEKYSFVIVWIIIIIVSETLLIAGLILNRRHRLSAEKRLHESEERYRTLINNAPDAIIVYDLDKNGFVEANPKALSLLGCSMEQLRSLNYSEFYTKANELDNNLPSIIREHLDKVLSGQIIGFERLITTYDKKEIYCDVTIVHLPSLGPKVIRASFTDITLRKDAEDKLTRLYEDLETIVAARTRELHATQEAFRQANIRLNLLTGITRHDILNQITGLLGYLEICLEDTPEGPTQSYLRSCMDLTRSVQAQIEFTRVYENIGTTEPIWQNLETIINRVHLLLPTITFNWHLDLVPVEILADPMFEKVFYTLVENSSRHGEHVTDIIFRATIRDADLLIVYEDNGVGIDEEDKPRIFDWSFGKHTGVGLFVSKQILAITEVTIRETGLPGEGVRFEIIVPKEKWKRGV